MSLPGPGRGSHLRGSGCLSPTVTWVAPFCRSSQACEPSAWFCRRAGPAHFQPLQVPGDAGGPGARAARGEPGMGGRGAARRTLQPWLQLRRLLTCPGTSVSFGGNRRP